MMRILYSDASALYLLKVIVSCCVGISFLLFISDVTNKIYVYDFPINNVSRSLFDINILVLIQ